jgi:hypothetical protein
MKTIITFFLALILGCTKTAGQVRTIEGKVITEDFEDLIQAGIKIDDSVVVGETDINGKFKI